MAVRSGVIIRGEDGLDRVADRLEAMSARARNVAPAMRAWGGDVRDVYEAQFRTEGAASLDRPWAPLSPRYAAWKARRFPGKTILRRTDEMHDSFTSRPMMIERVTASTGEFGARGKVPMWHQHGTRRMPARPIARATHDLADALARRVAGYIRRGTP